MKRADLADNAPGVVEAAVEVEEGLSHAAIVRRRIVAVGVLTALAAAGLAHRSDRVVHAEGRLGPKRWAEIRADGPGDVRERLKRRGDLVQANEPVALLALEGEDAAVTAAESDLAAARRQIDTVARQLDRVAEHSLVVPPPSVVDLGAWLEAEIRNSAPIEPLATEAAIRLRAIRGELETRKSRLRKRASKSLDPDERLSRAEAQILEAIRAKVPRDRLPGLDRALARYEDAIFEGLCALAEVSPSVVRDALGARGPGVAETTPPLDPTGARPADGYFEVQALLRRTQLELRQLETETTDLARLREAFPALVGERHGERKRLKAGLDELVARSGDARKRHENDLGADGERLRTEILRAGEDLLDGVSDAWARIGEGSVNGLTDLERNVALFRSSWSVLERALERQRAAMASGILVGRSAIEEQSVATEQAAGVLLDAVERLRISAEDLFVKRVGEVELAHAQKQATLELLRARLRKVMAAAQGADVEQPLEITRARYTSAVARAEWALKAAKLALEAKVIRAPMEGVVTSVSLHERTSLAKNEVVGVVEDLDGLVLKTLVPEWQLASIAVGQAARLSITSRTSADTTSDTSDGETQSVAGRVAWIGQGGLVVEKGQLPWNVLITVEGESASLMPGLLGSAEIVVGKRSGLDRLKELMHRAPPPQRRYLTPELPDPTRVLAQPRGAP